MLIAICPLVIQNPSEMGLCFFPDEEQGQDIGFVQYTLNFDNVVHDNIYDNPMKGTI